MTTLVELTERLKKPGVMSVLGVVRERNAQREMMAYFKALGKQIDGLSLGQLVGAGASKSRVVSIAEDKIDRVLTRLRPVLYAVLATNMQMAYLEAWHQFVSLSEADEHADPELDKLLRQAAKAARTALQVRRAGSVHASAIDHLGPSGKAAAAFAAKQAASQVTGIDKTTRAKLIDLITQAIEDRTGPDLLARMIRQELEDQSVYRSKIIAQTEINHAFSQAALDKMKSLDLAYKELVPSEDACPQCLAIVDQGPVPVDDAFSDGSQRPPIHPGCRCALVAARAPQGAIQ